MTVRQLEGELAALGCPRAEFGSIARTQASMTARKAWREANPQAAARYDELAARIDVELAAAELRESQARHLAALQRLLEAADVAPRESAALQNSKETGSLSAARRWWADASAPSWLVLMGRPGIGKTVAAVWVLMEAAKARVSVQYRRAREVVTLSQFDAGRREMDGVKRVGVLVLDDVGREGTSDYNRAVLFDVLDARHARRLRTVLCSNLQGGLLSAHLGEALADRIVSEGVRFDSKETKSLRGGR